MYTLLKIVLKSVIYRDILDFYLNSLLKTLKVIYNQATLNPESLLYVCSRKNYDKLIIMMILVICFGKTDRKLACFKCNGTTKYIGLKIFTRKLITFLINK